VHRFLKALPKIFPLSLIVLLVSSKFVLIFLDRPLIRGDGIAYLAWVDTIVLDRDLELQNQVEKLRSINTYQIGWNHKLQRFGIVFPFGIAFLQAPFYFIGHWFSQNNWLNYNQDYFSRMQGVGLPYSLWLMMGANLMALGTISAMYWIGRRWLNEWLAALVSFSVFAGTPLLYYSTVDILNSHSGASFTMTIFMWLLVVQLDAFREGSSPCRSKAWVWVLMGMMAGLTVLTRWQLAVSVAATWLILAHKRQWQGFWLSGVTAAITLLPLPLIWNQMFGAPFVMPFNELENRQFWQNENRFLLVLSSLLQHSPIVCLFFAGLPFVYRYDKAWAVLLFLMFVAQLIVNGAALDWHAGDSYGMRRMSELISVYGLGAAAFTSWIQYKLRRIGQLITVAFYATLICYTSIYFVSFLVWTWTNSEGFFIVEPWRMIQYWLEHPQRMQVLHEVIASHIGPWAWRMPGP
jgi:hypothetical protein